MYAMPTQHVITLYIHPDKGPIMPMQLDMLAIETTVMGLDAHSDRDEARVRQIAAHITKEFPRVDPHSNLHLLNQFISRFGHVALFNGVVLRLPGMIDGPPQKENPTPVEFQEALAEVTTLRDNIQGLQQRYDEVNMLVPALTSENEQLRKAYQKHLDSVNGTRQQSDMHEHNLHRAQAEVQQLKQRVAELERELGAKHVSEEKSVQELRAKKALQEEIGALRENLRNEREKNQKLRAEYEDVMQKYNALRERLRRTIEEPTQASNPWLDL